MRSLRTTLPNVDVTLVQVDVNKAKGNKPAAQPGGIAAPELSSGWSSRYLVRIVERNSSGAVMHMVAMPT